MSSNKLTPLQKAAAVVVSMGAERASMVYKYLEQSDIEKLTVEVGRILQALSYPEGGNGRRPGLCQNST